MDVSQRLQVLADRWAGAKSAERANAQSYLRELAEALGVEPPRPAGSAYEFEYAVRVVGRDGTETTNFIDLYKAGHFALEAKDEEPGRSPDLLFRKAFGQIRSYIGHLPHERPPYLIVIDIAKTMLIWDRWSGEYGGYNAGQRIDLRSLHTNSEAIALLRDVWDSPGARDPRGRAARVTKEIAGRLAELAAGLEDRGHDQEQVARFLIRCVFTMFAEDVDLLPDEPFREIIDRVALAHPDEFTAAVEDLWRAMDEGRRFGARQLLRFNGHFFHEAKALPLTRGDLALLLEASRADWKDVEPSIFGTLLVRALEPEERHRLGAEFTPREYVERLVRPTVEEPIRERWTLVQAAVLQLRESGKPKGKKAAIEQLREFHGWLRGLRFLDPACGSGNFLYVTLHTVKRIELEVIRLLEELTGEHALRLEEVSPRQFYGIEIKPWAREITELTLWIGFHQFWQQHHHVQPPEPILQDTGTLECRDAVLTWDSIRHDPARDRPDPTPRIRHPVTGELVPDPAAKLQYMEYVNPRPAPWPEADFIIGNPPYLGKGRQREALGDGYVDALREAYQELPDSADYVMYWWSRAAQEVIAGRTLRAGLITTNSIVKPENRKIIQSYVAQDLRLVWAVANHPWVDEVDSASVRVAMTVLSTEGRPATLVTVGDDGTVTRELRVLKVNADLTGHADVASAGKTPLLANAGLASIGFSLFGTGFQLSQAEAQDLLRQDAQHAQVVRPYFAARDFTGRPRGLSVIDFGLRSADEARAFPVLFDLMRDRVKPDRDANARASYREYWWRFGEPRGEWREASTGLARYIATARTAKHRMFLFLDSSFAPDEGIVCIASADPFLLGALSSAIHLTWALAAGGTLEDRPRYTKTLCFDPFPFPDPHVAIRERIAKVAERLDRHRKDALARGERVTMTRMYNVVARLRSGETLDEAEQMVHALGACGSLRDLHDELDALVASAYGWSWPEDPAVILERLVALHDERVDEERTRRVRWLRPEYQRLRFGAAEERVETLPLPTEAPVAPAAAAQDGRRWPRDAVSQLGTLRQLVAKGPLSAEEAARQFGKVKPEIVRRHLDYLALMGELHRSEDGRYHEVLQPA